MFHIDARYMTTLYLTGAALAAWMTFAAIRPGKARLGLAPAAAGMLAMVTAAGAVAAGVVALGPWPGLFAALGVYMAVSVALPPLVLWMESRRGR